MDFSQLPQGLIVATYAAFLTVIGWLIAGQIKTNKELARTITTAVAEFKAAIQDFNARDQLQQQTCEFHRRRTDDLKTELENHKKQVTAELKRIHTEIIHLKKEQ
jgi:Sec-independent protein translocase protein TatA